MVIGHPRRKHSKLQNVKTEKEVRDRGHMLGKVVDRVNNLQQRLPLIGFSIFKLLAFLNQIINNPSGKKYLRSKNLIFRKPGLFTTIQNCASGWNGVVALDTYGNPR